MLNRIEILLYLIKKNKFIIKKNKSSIDTIGYLSK